MPLTTEEFGQKIKQKYPQYQDMSDSELGNKMLTKYPQYQDMVSTKSQSFLGKITSIGKTATNVLVPRTKKYVTETLPEYYKEKPTGYLEELKKTVGIAPKAVEAGGELGAYAMPVGKGTKGAMKAGAGIGALLGITEEVPLKERLKKAGLGALVGGVAGGAMEVGGKAVGKVAKESKKLISQLFKPLTSEVQKLRKFHGLEFADEVITRDLPSIKGKGGEEILSYYENKVAGLENAADDFLANVDKTVSKKDIQKLVDEGLISREGRVLQMTAKNQLQNLKDDIVNLPSGNVGLVKLNQIKRDIQTAARSFYTAKGTPTPQSDALAAVARNVRQKIEEEAPGVKDVNSSIAFYHLAKDAIQRRLDQLSKSEMSWLTQMIGGGGLTASMITGKPGYAIAGLAPTLGREILKSPQVKTKSAAFLEKIGEKQMPEFLKKLILLTGGKAGSSIGK